MNIPIYKGKVRDVYDLGDKLILFASDRISAFDVVFMEEVPEKGKILTRISNTWFRFFKEFENHILQTELAKFPEPFCKNKDFDARSVLVKKADRINFECVVRGYLSGSALKEYMATGKVADILYPAGMRESEKFPEPIFTPARKNDSGHDENISEAVMRFEVGDELFSILKATSIELYKRAHAKMLEIGIILCDTKFEFGLVNGKAILIDELLTPDSSRYWESSSYQVGKTPASFDKQILRNWLEASGWDKNPPPPKLSEAMINKLKEKYFILEEKINLCLLQK